MIHVVSSKIFYNEFEPYAAKWLDNLQLQDQIPRGIVDARDVRFIKSAELTEYTQCHFFAGIGGWSAALRIAGWQDDWPVWTGSCPCQPFSSAGRKKGFGDDRHLWPTWFKLIEQCKPPVVFGEQVASPDGLQWFDVVCADMESAGYAVAAADLCAASVGAPHVRQRLYFAAVANATGRKSWPTSETVSRERKGLVAQTTSERWTWGFGGRGRSEGSGRGEHWWMPEPSICRVADGVPSVVAQLRAIGNAIVPQVGAIFIQSVMECLRG